MSTIVTASYEAKYTLTAVAETAPKARRLLSRGIRAYYAQYGSTPPPGWLEDVSISTLEVGHVYLDEGRAGEVRLDA
jgi:hypothetical protein